MRPTDPLSPFRMRAHRLLRQLRSADRAAALAAAERFRTLRVFADRPAEALLAARDGVRLKHALTVIAEENGHPSWVSLKAAAQAAADPPMWARGLEVLLNRWFARYEDARASLEAMGGYLLPYRQQFFVCEEEGIRVLGLDPADPDWSAIGHDWVRPADPDAWRRLRARRSAAAARR